MGRRLNTSQPTVIQTMLTPLSDSFSIKNNDVLEQWFYVNTGEYSPDRTITPLQLEPTIVCVDTDTNTRYTPSFLSVVWYYFNPSNTTDYSSTYPTWPGLGWVPITAVEAQTGGVLNDYYCPTTGNPNFKLYVQKNVAPPTGGDATAGQAICCRAKYIDPRDSGVTIDAAENVTLATNKDATTKTLTLNLLAPTKTIFNVFTDTNTTFSFSAQVLDNSNTDVTSSYYIEWYGKINGGVTETLINLLDCYINATQQLGKGQGTDTISINAMFAEQVDIVCRLRKTSSSALLPAVAYCSLVWEYPEIKAITTCKNGRKVNSENRDMTFYNIVNHKKNVLTDEQKAANLLFNFKKRISTSSSMTDLGWGQEITVPSNTLAQSTSYSTPVHAEVYMMGAYERVTDDNADVTDDDELIYDRQ